MRVTPLAWGCGPACATGPAPVCVCLHRLDGVPAAIREEQVLDSRGTGENEHGKRRDSACHHEPSSAVRHLVHHHELLLSKNIGCEGRRFSRSSDPFPVASTVKYAAGWS